MKRRHLAIHEGFPQYDHIVSTASIKRVRPALEGIDLVWWPTLLRCGRALEVEYYDQTNSECANKRPVIN